MSICQIWIDFFKLNLDFTLRGLAMPILASLNAAVVVILAKTPTKKDATAEPIEVIAPEGIPMKTQEVETKPEKHPPKL